MSLGRGGLGVRADGRGQDLVQAKEAKWKLEGRVMEGFPIRKPLQVDSDGLGWAGPSTHLSACVQDVPVYMQRW